MKVKPERGSIKNEKIENKIETINIMTQVINVSTN